MPSTRERVSVQGQPTALSGAQLFNLAEDIGDAGSRGDPSREVKELSADWLRWSSEMANPLWGPGPGGRGRGGVQAVL